MIDLTPKWKQILRDHPEAHTALQWVTTSIFKEQVNALSLPCLKNINLNPAFELGLISLMQEKVFIPDSDVLREYIIRYAVDRVALPSWDDLESFSNAIKEIRQTCSILNIRHKTVADVLLILALEHSKDLLGMVAKVARLAVANGERKWPFWAIYPTFCEILPQLVIAPADLARELEPVIQATDGDYFGGSVYDAVENMARRSKTLAYELVNAFIARPDSPAVGLAVNALVALATFKLKDAHCWALNLLSSQEPTLRRVGIASLGRFEYANDKSAKFLRITLEHLEILRTTSDDDTDYFLVRTYGDLLQYAETAAEEALVEMAGRSNPAVQNQLSFVLLRVENEAYHKPWFQEALLRLAPVSSSHKQTLRNLDQCAARCVKDFPQVSISFLQKQIVSGDYGSEGSDSTLPKMFSSTYTALISNQHDLLIEIITLWFASDEPCLYKAARDIVQHKAYAPRGATRSFFVLSTKVLNELEEQVIIHMLMRIMGHVANSRALAALLVSTLQRIPCPQLLVTFVTDALSEYVLYNYPSEVGEYLRGSLENTKDNIENIIHKVICAALARSDVYLESRRQLPAAKELKPPSNHLNLLRLAQQKQQASMMEEANKQSPLLSMIPMVPLKYGRAFFMELEGSFTALSHLGSVSTQWERPRGEFIDPLGQAHQRMWWQYAGLNVPVDDLQPDVREETDT